MAFLFNDTLQSYALGPGTPTGFEQKGLVFLSQFEEPASPTPAPGYYERQGVIYALFGQIAWPVDADLSGSSTATTSVAYYTLKDLTDPGTPGTLQLASCDPVSLQSATLLSVVFESDGSVSLSAPGAKINSLLPVDQYADWWLVQVTASFGSITVGGISVVTVTCSLAVSGQVLISGAVLTTNIPVSTLWNTSSGINQWLFTGPPNGVYFGEFAATTTLETLPWFPNPAPTVRSLDSQMVVELMSQFNPNARLTQGVVELMSNFVPNARCTQMVVELIIAGAQGGLFPEYIKSRHKPSH